jgi:ParB family transcriptional regulator, chromosome partitioning protein
MKAQVATGAIRSPKTTVSAMEIARRLARSDRLSRRRYELLPLSGPGAPFTDVQGREPGQSTAPAHLVDLISSIASVGVLQPILVEEPSTGPLRVVAGERRLRAARWGAVNLPDNPHFGSIPAVVCPGPLSEEERRIWQLVENLAREDLRPGELAAALTYERCAVLTAKLLAAGVAVPSRIAAVEHPVERFRALDRVRVAAGATQLGAPWEEVLRRLGLQLSADRAKQLVRAFAALPVELSIDMDASRVALATRLDYLRLDRGGRKGAAAELWEAVKRRGDPALLAGAIRIGARRPGVEPDAAVALAATLREDANRARAAAQKSRTQDEPVPADLIEGALAGLRALLAALRRGAGLERYDAGSLRLLAEELLGLIDADRKDAA